MHCSEQLLRSGQIPVIHGQIHPRNIGDLALFHGVPGKQLFPGMTDLGASLRSTSKMGDLLDPGASANVLAPVVI